MDGAEDDSMAAVRAEIDRLDAGLVALLARRVACIDRAARIKARTGLAARLDDRVAQVLAQVRGQAQAQGLPPDLAEELWRGLIDWSIAREERHLAGNVTGERGDDGAGD